MNVAPVIGGSLGGHARFQSERHAVKVVVRKRHGLLNKLLHREHRCNIIRSLLILLNFANDERCFAALFKVDEVGRIVKAVAVALLDKR